MSVEGDGMSVDEGGMPVDEDGVPVEGDGMLVDDEGGMAGWSQSGEMAEVETSDWECWRLGCAVSVAVVVVL